jgi:glycosyltransferase involved in cell wall biosynthesis
MTPLVSILIPAFNAEDWIADTIKSAIGQTWQRKEIIIVDDGSRDQTVSIAQQFASKELKLVTQQNQGSGAARNKAFGLCQGDFIQWLDADDLLGREKVAKQMEAARECPGNRTLFSSGWGFFAYRTERAKFSPTSLWCDLSPAEFLLRKMGENVYMANCTWLVSRELTEAAGPWDTRLCHDDDGEYFCRVILASNGIRFVPEGRVFYRITASKRQSHVGRSDKKRDALHLSMRLHVKYLLSLEDSARVRAACVKFLQSYLFQFYPERPELVQELSILAKELGGSLEVPQLRRKYAWLKPLFGYRFARHTQMMLPRLRQTFKRSWDKVGYQLQGGKSRLLI